MYLLLCIWCTFYFTLVCQVGPVQASLEEVCNRTLTQSSGVINIPYNETRPDTNCEVLISAPPGDFIIFSILSMSNRYCSSYLSLYDGNSSLSPLIDWTCYASCSQPYHSSFNSMFLNFTVSPRSTMSLSATYFTYSCPPFKYLIDCSGTSPCVQENTNRCSARDGRCECKDGWTSWDCSQDINECLSPTACPEYSTCVNLNGSYECHCFEGLRMSDAGQCEVESQCTASNCSHVCVKVNENNEEVEKCLCPVGSKLSGNVCTECSHFKYGGNCEHSCLCSVNGTASCDPRTGNCTCLPGWTSDFCQQDVNECYANWSICGYGGYCLNTIGSYDCRCYEDYEKSPLGYCQLPTCESVLTNSTGVITTPLYPSLHYLNSFCSWLITAEEGSIILLNSSSPYSGCNVHNFVNVYDGPSTSSPLIVSQRSCGFNGSLLSTQNSLLITLNSIPNNTFSYGVAIIATYETIRCPAFTYLQNCSASCNCVQANSLRCDILTGSCVCRRGWTSADCSVNQNECIQSPCLNYTTCTDTIGSYVCQCQDGLQMDPVTGQCEVPFGSSCKQRNCSDLCVQVLINGQEIEKCLCPLGNKLEGDICQACSNSTYGADCQWNCSCVKNHTVSCDPINGQCSCLPGWTSDDCSVDLDECSSRTVSCGLYSECINTPGSYMCQCSDYYTKDFYGNCLYTGCVKNLTQTSGVIKSPNYPYKYNSNSNCRWTISVPENYIIRFNITTLQAECNYDYLTVYDGLSTSSRQLGRYCALSLWTVLISSANYMFITFTSDSSVENSGFMAIYNASGCPPFKYLPDCSGECNCVQENALGCNVWTGQCLCKSGYYSTDCSDVDECQIANACPEYAKCINLNGSFRCECFEGLHMSYSGVCVVNSSSQCTDRNCSHLCARVVVNNTIAEKCYCPIGRELNGNSCEVCSNFTYGENCQSNCSCSSDCDPVNGRCWCRPGWESANCSVDVDECSMGWNRCGVNASCINTPGSFRCQCSDNFELNALGTCTFKCVHNFTQSSGVITSPSYPSSYEPYSNSSWLITVADNNFITLSFSALNLECGYDYVTVYDGNNSSATQLGRHCQKPLTSVRSTSNTMYITFTSDGSVQYTGFMATYNSTGCPPFRYLPPECNGTCSCVQENTRYCNSSTGQCVCKAGWTAPDCLVDVNECLDLPCMNYSQCINHNGSYECNCLNGLTKSPDSGLCEVNINSTCTKKNCSHICVKVTENNKKVEKCYCPLGSKLVGTTCRVCDKFTYGSECQNKCSCTSKNAVTCDPVHGHCTCLPGWTSQNCSIDINECSTGNVTCGKNSYCVNTPGSYKCVCLDNYQMDSMGYCVFKGFIYKLTNSSGEIKSPGYPYFYNNFLNSRWTITVTKGYRIHLFFLDVNTERGYDDVKIYDGDSELSKQIGRFYSLPNEVLVSTGNKLFILFTSDGDINGTGFMATYNSTQL